MTPCRTDDDLQLLLGDIPGSGSWTAIHEIAGGDSSERKFDILDKQEQRWLVRIADSRKYERKKTEYCLLDHLSRYRCPVPQPAAYGLCHSGRSAYLMTEWIEGIPVFSTRRIHPEQDLLAFQNQDKYTLGHVLGSYLRAIHSTGQPFQLGSCPDDSDHVLDILQRYGSRSELQLSCIRHTASFLAQNRLMSARRPQVLLHGDLNPGNIIRSYASFVFLIDFEKACYGDPMIDLAPVVTDISQLSQAFATGVLDSYFSGTITVKQLRILAYYSALHAMRLYVQAERSQESSRQMALNRVRYVSQSYSQFRNIFPGWYKVPSGGAG